MHPNARPRKTILLDALGTLLALDPPAPRLRSELQRRFGVALTAAQAEAAIAAEIRYYRAHLDEGRDQPSLQALRSRCAEALRSALPASAASLRVSTEALTDALLASLHFSAFADAEPALRRWRAAGARLVVVSNWDVSLHEVLARLSLAPLLDAILTSAESGVRKPAPAIFERALMLAGTEPRDAVHIGDSRLEDVEGARAAGIEPVLIVRDGSERPPGLRTIAGLGEFDP